jgi:SulP family sulfate permease
MIHALTLLAILIFAAPLAKFIPLPVLAAILMVVSYNMGEWREIPEILKLTKSDISVWIVTFLLTVFADLTVAVEAGMILATLLFIRKVTITTTVSEVTDAYVDEGRVHILQDKTIPDYLRIFRIHGPFLFGATEKIAMIYDQIGELPPIVVLRLRNMTAIDATGIKALKDVAEALHKSGRTLILCGAREQPAMMMKKAEFEECVGSENICPNVEAALQRAKEVYKQGSELKKQFAAVGK